ncbi:formate dehydrogenase subunit delta [Sphingomonas sp. YR710]|nr:formate dehydrogenase subunit delta [Sphingomonas sp. YR710]
MSNLERLVYMANQIARNFAATGDEAAARATADHIMAFWDPRMRAQLVDRLAAAPESLEPPARQAATILRDRGDRGRATSVRDDF